MIDKHGCQMLFYITLVMVLFLGAFSSVTCSLLQILIIMSISLLVGLITFLSYSIEKKRKRGKNG